MFESVTREKMSAEAIKRGWTVNYFGPEAFFYEISTPDGRHCLLRGSMPQSGSWIGNYIARHKLVASDYLEHRGFSVPPAMLYTDEDSAATFLGLHKTIVVKPEDSEKSQGVTVNITDMEHLKTAVTAAGEYSDQVILQKQLSGKLYRVLVIGGKLCAVSHRRAAFVVGDGVMTVRALIHEKNKHPWRTDDGRLLTKISLHDAEDYVGLERLDSIPEKGEEVILSAIDSISRGGEAADVTDSIHSDYVALVERVAQELGLPSCGLDIMTDDIAQPLPSEMLPILEINSMPGFKMHYYPTAGGEPRDVASVLLDTIFPKNE